jgi:predicted ABC-type sugar transport system permease subunit
MLLGNNLDTMNTSNCQATTNSAKGNQRYNLMKAVSGSDWGHDKKTLLLTYKALVGSVFDFCAPIYFLNLKPFNIAKMQIVQIRLATGSLTCMLSAR